MMADVLVPVRVKWNDYLELTKPRINFLVVLTCLVGFAMASYGPWDWTAFFHLVLGTTLVVAGGAALNEYWEKDIDLKMNRTANRPIPAGKIVPEKALIFGAALTILGILHLAVRVNLATAFLSCMAFVSYVLVYTPLKSRSSLCTLVGAIPGAIPPMMGWSALRNNLSFEAWVLFGIMFFWQLPHFLSLAFVYREDYARAGLKMLPMYDKDGRLTVRQIIHYTMALIVVSLLPSFSGMAGRVYFCAALFLGILFLVLALRCASLVKRLNSDGKVFEEIQGELKAQYMKFFYASIIYLPLLFLFLVIDKI
jgi:protoheme IX farnesyltransferase